MPKGTRPRAQLKVLFIGNSFTARNDLPNLITQLAAVRGKGLQHRLISAGGASLRTHWNAGTAQKAIQGDGNDFVVLHEQSTLPIKNAARMRENILLFDEAIKAAGAKTVLYMTWARRDAPETQEVLTEAYESIGRELGAIIVPVGVAWQRCIQKYAEPVLHDRDQSHPTLAGSYLAACMFLTVLLKTSPVGIVDKVSGLNEQERMRLQKVAWQCAS